MFIELRAPSRAPSGKYFQINMLKDFHDSKKLSSLKVLDQIKESALNQKNIFEVLMEATKHCSLGQITQSLFDVGGQYRRNM